MSLARAPLPRGARRIWCGAVCCASVVSVSTRRETWQPWSICVGRRYSYFCCTLLAQNLCSPWSLKRPSHVCVKGGGHDWQGVSFIQLTHTHQKLTAKVLSGSCTQLECLARLRYAGAGIFDPTAPRAFLALPCCRHIRIPSLRAGVEKSWAHGLSPARAARARSGARGSRERCALGGRLQSY